MIIVTLVCLTGEPVGLATIEFKNRTSIIDPVPL